MKGFLFFFVSLTATVLWYYGLFTPLENILYDARVRLIRSKVKPHEGIAVILIDEASLKLMNSVVGRWPWPRSVHADVIDFLRIGGAKAIVFDVLFTEKERGSSESLGENDLALVEATQIAGNVYHAAQVFRDVPDEWNRELLDKPLPEDFVERFSLKGPRLIHVEKNNNYAIPFRELYLASKGIGIVEFTPDPDGIYRRTPLIREYQGNFFPVLSLAPLIGEAGNYSLREEDGRLLITVDGKEVEVPYSGGNYLINLYGGFEPYSMSGILASIQKIRRGEIDHIPVSPEEFKDKVVFIGGSAVGVEDLKPTSIAPRTPGVLLHASIYSNILKKDFLKKPPEVLTLFLIALISLSVFFLIFKIRTYALKISLSAAPVVAFLVLSFIAFRFNLVLEVSPPLFSGILSFITGFTYLSLTEERERRRIKNMLGRYVSPAVLAAISEKSQMDEVILGERGTRVELTVLFSDIAGFTSLSERLSPEDVVDLLNCYFKEVVEIIHNNGGTVDKFMGDAVMAFWGAPLKLEDHALRAVLTALEINDAMEHVNSELRKRGLPEIRTGTGINTGEVILGNIGSPRRLDYTVIGDNVNLASRLEGLTRFYGVPIIISESTAERLDSSVCLRVIDLVRVKGKERPIRIFEPMRPSERNVKIALLSEKAFQYYLDRRWQEALDVYREVQRLMPDDRVSGIFIERILFFMEREPEPSWDGVWRFLEK